MQPCIHKIGKYPVSFLFIFVRMMTLKVGNLTDTNHELKNLLKIALTLTYILYDAIPYSLFTFLDDV